MSQSSGAAFCLQCNLLEFADGVYARDEVEVLRAKASKLHVLVLDVSMGVATTQPWPANWHYIPYKLNWHYVPVLPGREVAIADRMRGRTSYDADTAAVRSLACHAPLSPRCNLKQHATSGTAMPCLFK